LRWKDDEEDEKRKKCFRLTAFSFWAELTSDSQATSIQNKMRGHKVPVREGERLAGDMCSSGTTATSL